MSRRLLSLVAGLAAVLLASGCTSIPTQGPVNAGRVQDPGAANPIGLFPATPAPGAGPEEVVNGFLAAATGQQDDYRVARQFLAPAIRKRWKPLARVLVNDGGLRVKQTAPGAVSVAVPVVASVGAHGVYRSGRASSPTMLRFALARIGGEWRITQAADGIVLGDPVFPRLFEPVTIQAFDPTYRRLFPDLRWLPIRSDNGVATARDIVDALLAGPAGPLQEGVTASPFPRGTRRAGVTVEGGTAVVDLTVPGRTPSTQVQQRMLTVLGASLRRGSIQGVRLSINRVERDVRAVVPVRPPQPVPQPIGLKGRAFGLIVGGRVTSDVLQRAVGALRPSAVTISDSQNLAAVRTSAGVSVVTRAGTSTAARVVDRRADLVDPALDPQGFVYSVPQQSPDALRVVDRQGASSAVVTAFPVGTAVRAIEVSRDGSRLLALLETADRPVALVVGIVRDLSGRPVRLTDAAFRVAVGTGTAVDATWVDAGTVATVTQDQDGAQVTIQQVGGEASPGGRPTSAAGAVGATSPPDLVVRATNGTLFTVPQGSVWVPTGAVADVLAVQR